MAGYVGNVPVPQSVREDQSFTATAGQTTFNTLGYTDGTRIKVTLNGVLLEGGGVDYTATNGSDVVLTSGAAADDIVRFETFNEFNLVNQNLTTPTFTDSASVTSTTTASVSVSGDTTATLSLKNNTHEDTDGGRESTLIFQGEQSGGEISTLAEIEASHDGTADDQKGDLIFRTNDGSDGTSPTEALRIDSTGAVIASNGLTVDDDGATVLTVDRATSDGTVIDIQKDGTSVGNIAARVGHLRIGNDDIGLEFHKTNNAIYPANLTAGTLPDNTTDLGASNIRFKDIYTSGGIYLGAASNSTPVAANYLDDYEEGEYTPLLYGYTTGSGTLLPLRSTHNVLSYTKVGRKVSVNGKIETSGSHSAQGSLLLSIPFTGANLTDQAGQGAGSCFFYRTGQLHENPTVIFGEGVDYVYFFSNTSGGDVLGITADVMDSAIELIVGFTYFTT